MNNKGSRRRAGNSRESLRFVLISISNRIDLGNPFVTLVETRNLPNKCKSNIKVKLPRPSEVIFKCELHLIKISYLGAFGRRVLGK